MWQEILGHEEVFESFRRAHQHARIASSYLFLGPSGVGKRTFAEKLAQTLLCLQRDESEFRPCQHCQSCRLCLAGNHPDLDRLKLPEGRQKLPVELFIGDREHRNREGLCHNIAMRPLVGSRRVAIIDDADHMSLESANSLLKTLEEPPPGAVLILIGTSRGRQLPTILSRTQVVRFQPLTKDQLQRLLLDLGIAKDASHAESLAQACEGSLEKAATLADQELWDLGRQLLSQFSPDRFDSQRLARELTEFVNQAGKEASLRRERIRLVLQMVISHFRRHLRGSCGDGEQHLLAQDLLPPECALALLDRCLEAEVELDRYANQSTLLECWLDDLAGILSGPSAEAVSK